MSQRRPSGRPSAYRRRCRAVRSALAAAVVVVGVLVAAAGPALAAPAAPPPNPTDQQLGQAATTVQQASAEVGRLSGLVGQAESDLEKVAVQAEAAGQAYDAAQHALEQAQAAAEQARTQLAAATAAVGQSQARIADFSHDSYINGGSLTSVAALLDAKGPGELIQRAATLDWVAANQLDVLGQLQTAQLQQASAASAAQAARDRQAAAERAAATAKQTADSQLAAQQTAYDQVAAQKAGLQQQLQAAQIQLLQLQGARDAYQQWVAQQQAEQAAAAAAAAAAQQRAASSAATARAGGGSGYVLPVAGITSSCFGGRWGVQHLGVDIAASIGTPIYAATSGEVKRAGPATGFGLAVYILGDDGAVTVYGHVNRYFVQAGERVGAGEQIAEVGNRGNSTGPHLHFEVHPDGEMYGGAVDPAPWLRAREVPFSGC
jgi:murein DD-endopeptidase MepM/ murein hydrolase activator NlpD